MELQTLTQTKRFYDLRLYNALKACNKGGFRAAFMPEIADMRIIADKNSEFWQDFCSTPSIKATGKTARGSKVVVYAHIPNYFSNPETIKTAFKKGELIDGAGIMPQKEFQKLLDKEDGEKVFVVDYNKLKKSDSGIVPVHSALEHPQTIPFLGGEKRAEKYLAKHKDVYSCRIGVWHSDDLHDRPVGRLLSLGSGRYYDGSILGDNEIDSIEGHFIGMPENAESACAAVNTPNLAQLINASSPYISQFLKTDLVKKHEKIIRELYE